MKMRKMAVTGREEKFLKMMMTQYVFQNPQYIWTVVIFQTISNFMTLLFTQIENETLNGAKPLTKGSTTEQEESTSTKDAEESQATALSQEDTAKLLVTY